MKSLDGIRTDVVGSLLRPDALARARLRHERGEIGDGEFRAAENEAVDRAIRLQEQIGLDVITDGEFRRLNFQDSFGEAVSGYDARTATLRFLRPAHAGAQPLQRSSVRPSDEHRRERPSSQRQRVVERLRLSAQPGARGIQLRGRVARKPVKVTLIGPDRISQRVDLANSSAVYPDDG